MTRIAGIIDVVEQETVKFSSVPSQVEVTHCYKKTMRDLETVEKILVDIGVMMHKLLKWQHQGFIDSARIDAVVEDRELLLFWLKRLQERIVERATEDFDLCGEGYGI